MGLRWFICAVSTLFAGCEEAPTESCSTFPSKLAAHSVPVDLDGVAPLDRMVKIQDHTALYLACGEARFVPLVEGSANLAVSPEEDGWSSIFVNSDEGDPWLRIGDQAYRFDRMPFESQVPAPPPIRHGASGYSADLPLCNALGVRAQLYSNIATQDLETGPRLSSMVVTSDGSESAVKLSEDEFYRVTATHEIDGNGDDVADMLVLYEDRYGSGQETRALLMLGCGEGGFILSGSITEPVDRDFAMAQSEAGGFIVKQQKGESPFAAYRVDPVTHGLRRIDEGGTEASMVEALASRRHDYIGYEP